MRLKAEELVGGDVGGAAAVAGGGLSSLDVQVQQLHLQEGNIQNNPSVIMETLHLLFQVGFKKRIE